MRTENEMEATHMPFARHALCYLFLLLRLFVAVMMMMMKNVSCFCLLFFFVCPHLIRSLLFRTLHFVCPQPILTHSFIPFHSMSYHAIPSSYLCDINYMPIEEMLLQSIRMPSPSLSFQIIPNIFTTQHTFIYTLIL